MEKSVEGGIDVSLIKCPECGKSISSVSDKCTYCGYPLNKVSQKKKIKQFVVSTKFVVIIIAVLGMIILGNLMYHNSKAYVNKQYEESKAKYDQAKEELDDLKRQKAINDAILESYGG